MSRLVRALPIALLLTVASVCSSAPSVYLRVKAMGNDIQGGSTVRSMEREGTIECLSYDSGATCPREASGKLTGRRTYTPVTITKRIDCASVLLMKALTRNEVCECEFRFYTTLPSGEQAHMYQVTLTNAYISSIRQYVPPEGAEGPGLAEPVEEVSWVFGDIKWTYMDGGIEHQDTWSGDAAASSSPESTPGTTRPLPKPGITPRRPSLRNVTPGQ